MLRRNFYSTRHDWRQISISTLTLFESYARRRGLIRWVSRCLVLRWEFAVSKRVRETIPSKHDHHSFGHGYRNS